MHPYTQSWLAHHAVPLTIAAMQLGIAALAARQRRFLLAVIVLLAAATTFEWLLPSLIALARWEPLPSSSWEPFATAAPFLAVSAAGLLRRTRHPRMDLRTLLPLCLFSHGLPAIVLWLSLVISGSLTTAARRGALAAGIALWASIDVVHGNRFALSSALHDPEGQQVALIEASLAAGAWTALGVWMTTPVAAMSALERTSKPDGGSLS